MFSPGARTRQTCAPGESEIPTGKYILPIARALFYSEKSLALLSPSIKRLRERKRARERERERDRRYTRQSFSRLRFLSCRPSWIIVHERINMSAGIVQQKYRPLSLSILFCPDDGCLPPARCYSIINTKRRSINILTNVAELKKCYNRKRPAVKASR